MANDKYVFWDLDGVLISWPGYSKINFSQVSKLYSNLEKIKAKHLIITNRPAVQILPFIYNLRADETVHLTESGSVLFNPSKFVFDIHPRFKEFAKTNRPEIIKYLSKNYLNKTEEIKEIPGSIVKIELVTSVNKQNSFYNLLKKDPKLLRLLDGGQILKSKIIEIVPEGFDKCRGVEFLDNANIDWKNSLFIADSDKDIKIAQKLNNKGVTICSVGNGKTNYRNIVKNSNGILAPTNTSHHESVNHILKEYFNKIKK